ncbi:MAG: peptidase S58 family protein [Desulfobulbaceae bacterium]|nr:MAG: peptidase S58 family protein [Desulfobulbaceae bacterium]
MIERAEFSLEGIEIGHATDRESATGCTVILSREGSCCGVDVRGGAPGTRETDLLRPENLVDQIHGLLLTGGSAFGLDAAGGVMEFLEAHSCGFDVGVTRVPIVCGAALFDLTVGDHQVRPDREMGYQACQNCVQQSDEFGNVGCATGASVGKIRGNKYAMKGGFGCWTVQCGELIVTAGVGVNCLGDVVDPTSGEKVAGVLDENRTTIGDSEMLMATNYDSLTNLFSGNTSIGVVATNGAFDKAQLSKIASMAQNGFARTIYPAHTMYDGDTIFALSHGSISADLSSVGLLASRCISRAVVMGVKNAQPAYGLKASSDLQR